MADRSDPKIQAHQASERYQAFIRNSSEGIWRFELPEPVDTTLPIEDQIDAMYAGSYLAECNDAMARMYGFERADELAGVALETIMPAAQPENRAYLRAFIEARYSLVDAESVEVDRHGNPKHFLNSLIGIVAEGRLLRAWGTQRDMTESKKVSERLRLSEQRLQALVSASADFVWATAADGRMEWITPSWEAITGQNFEAARELGWLKVVHPDDVAPTTNAWQKALSARQRYDHFARILRKDGVYRWFHLQSSLVFNEDGTAREWVGSGTDVDAQRRQEEAAAADTQRAEFIAAANDLFAQSLEYEQTLRNVAELAVPRLADWCTVDMVDEGGYLRRLAVKHVDPRQVQTAHELSERFPAHREDEHGGPSVVRTGRTEWVADISDELLAASARSEEHLEILRSLQLRSFICVPIRTHSGVAGALTLINGRDAPRYTQREVSLAEDLALRAGQAIQNARLYERALEANRAKDEFLATLSHELRTPLTAILGWASLLRISDSDAVTVRRGLETIEHSAQTQATLIDDLLDVSRIVTGKFRLEVNTVDAVPLIQNVIASAQPAIEAKRITIDVHSPPSLHLRADGNRLQQILWNLMSNAVKFSEDGGRVALSLRRENDDAIVEVADRGIGIPPELLPHVFDRFWQADSSNHRVHGGLGLGLAIVKHLTELHGGTVSATSEGRERGSKFVVTLPIGL